MRQEFIRKIKDTLLDIDPDIIVATTYWNADIVCNLKCRGKKVIESHCAKSHTNMNEFANTSFTKKILESVSAHIYNRIVEKKCDALVALTRHDAKEWGKARRTVIIPNAIHQATHPDNALTHRRVIAVGRLSYQKGFDRLIRAWETVAGKHPDWRLDIYGNGTYREALQNQVNAAHMENIITLHPATSDIFHEYATSSILALSSNYEGYGLTLIEAMSCGVPCISFDCPYGPLEIIRNGTDGILIPNGDIEKMAQAICYLIENEKIRAKYGQAAQENIKRLLPENIMLQWKQLFNQLTK